MQAVGDSQHGAVGELLSNHLLHNGVRLVVDGGRGLGRKEVKKSAKGIVSST